MALVLELDILIHKGVKASEAFLIFAVQVAFKEEGVTSILFTLHVEETGIY